MEDKYFRIHLKDDNAYIIFNLGKRIISRTFTKSNIKEKKGDHNYYLTSLNNPYKDIYISLFKYIMSSKKQCIMKHDNVNYKVELKENDYNHQLQINLSSKEVSHPGNTIIKSQSNKYTYKDIISKCNEYCISFSFNLVNNKGNISIDKMNEDNKYVDIKEISQIFCFLNEEEISQVFNKKKKIKIEKDPLNKTITVKNKDLNVEESFKKYVYRSRNPKLQNQFRKALIAESRILNNGFTCCALCGIDYSEEMLVASHIIPVRLLNDSSLGFTNESIYSKDNGLLLCPNHDMLIDKELISFDEEGKIELGNIDKETLKKFGLDDKYVLNDIYYGIDRKQNFRYHLADMKLSKIIK